MSHHQQYGFFVFECDECDEPLETEENNFGAAQKVAKEAGWANVKDGNKWGNLCPGCVKELAQE